MFGISKIYFNNGIDQFGIQLLIRKMKLIESDIRMEGFCIPSHQKRSLRYTIPCTELRNISLMVYRVYTKLDEMKKKYT